jgi:glutathione peroxidase-family protein
LISTDVLQWAEIGECVHNPDYMLRECAETCARFQEIQLEHNARVGEINSFFDLEGIDIQGNPYPFSQLEGKVTVVVNVASQCGFTESHYKGLVELWSSVQQEGVQILAFPCNQFGKQEPGTAEEIEAFAKSKGVQFKMMQKVDVNGPNTSLIYLYLKSQTDVTAISWNFGTYFVVAPDGAVTAHTGVAPMHLKPFIFELLGKEEL